MGLPQEAGTLGEVASHMGTPSSRWPCTAGVEAWTCRKASCGAWLKSVEWAKKVQGQKKTFRALVKP